jgi:hypothetical protein
LLRNGIIHVCCHQSVSICSNSREMPAGMSELKAIGLARASAEIARCACYIDSRSWLQSAGSTLR